MKNAYDATKSTMLGDPDKVTAMGDFVAGAVDPGPPPQTPAGAAGYAVSKGYDALQSKPIRKNWLLNRR